MRISLFQCREWFIKHTNFWLLLCRVTESLYFIFFPWISSSLMRTLLAKIFAIWYLNSLESFGKCRWTHWLKLTLALEGPTQQHVRRFSPWKRFSRYLHPYNVKEPRGGKLSSSLLDELPSLLIDWNGEPFVGSFSFEI